MSEPDVFERTYAAARVLQREVYTYTMQGPYATAPEDFDALAAQARELARMLDRCGMTVDDFLRSTETDAA